MSTTGGGKKKKGKKGTTLSLNSFLGDSATIAKPVAAKSSDWGDDDDLGPVDLAEEYGGPPKPHIDLSKLPNAPRASRGVDIDFSKLPNKPPYTAFLGNLPFETSEEDIVHLFRGLRVDNIRFPQGHGKSKGFGYAEFNDLDQLKAALALSGETLGGRQIRIDIAGKDQREGGGGFGRGGFSQMDDRTDNDWRRGGDDDPPPQRDDRRGGGFDRRGPPRDDIDGGRPPRPLGAADLDDCWRRDEKASEPSTNGWGDRGGRRDDGWGRRQGGVLGDRDGPRDGFRDGPRNGFRDGPRDGFRDGPRDNYRDGRRDGFRDGPRDGYRDGPRDGYRDGPRDGFRDGQRDNYRDGPRDGFRDGPRDNYRDGPRDNYRDGPRDGFRDGPRDGFRDGPRDGFRDGPRDNYRDGPRDRGFRDDRGPRGYRDDRGPHDGDRFDDDFGGGSWRDGCAPPVERKITEPTQEKERPKLNLKPRTVESADKEKTPTSSIFGGARPVDTASKERMIEEKLAKSPNRSQNRDNSRERSRDKPRDRSREKGREPRDQPRDQSRGRGRGQEKPKKNRDKEGNIVPPKYEEPAKVAWGQSSKFALLAAEDEDADGGESNEEVGKEQES